MYTPNGRLSKRKTIQLMVALTILAWATQTLFSQWGYGAEPEAASAVEPVLRGQAEEKFIAPVPVARFGATLEVRSEATVVGAEVQLKQVCRWSEADNAQLAPLADLVIARFGPGRPFKSISVNEIKSTLQDAKVNLAGINFVGSMSCTINRSDAHYDQQQALSQWIEARQGDQPASPPPAAAAPEAVFEELPAKTPSAGETRAVGRPAPAVVQSPATEPAATQEPEKTGVRTLRDLLTADIAQRFQLPLESLQMNFKPLDEKVLNLSEPLFRFQIEPTRVRDLGEVEWDVILVTENGNKKVTIGATARAWQNQAILAKPLGYRQIITDADVVERRTLINSLSDETLVTREQAVGQQAARELKPGTILTARMLDPVELVKAGQFVTITVSHGGVSIKTVARAMEGGSLGQSIKVKNEATKEIYDVVLTGPQTASLNADAPASKVAATN